MFITRHALESAQLEVTLDEQGLGIEGMNPMPKSVIRRVHDISTELAYTPIEHDDLMSYVANVTIWRVLKGITSV